MWLAVECMLPSVYVQNYALHSQSHVVSVVARSCMLSRAGDVINWSTVNPNIHDCTCIGGVRLATQYCVYTFSKRKQLALGRKNIHNLDTVIHFMWCFTAYVP